MACCLTVPSHYLNQCWLIIKFVLWYIPGSNFTRSANKFKSHNIANLNLSIFYLSVQRSLFSHSLSAHNCGPAPIKVIFTGRGIPIIESHDRFIMRMPTRVWWHLYIERSGINENIALELIIMTKLSFSIVFRIVVWIYHCIIVDKQYLWLINPNRIFMVIIENNQMSLSGIYSGIYRLQHDHFLSL